MEYHVELTTVTARPTAVLAAETTWAEFPRVWGPLLSEVHAQVAWGGPGPKGRNIMLYRDDRPHVEVGVELDQPVELNGRIARSELPAGRVARTVHSGGYEGLRDAHDAVVHWCGCQGLERTGVRWEIYGHWAENPAEVTTEIYWQLR
jgi:effector-binding domain-containing protein